MARFLRGTLLAVAAVALAAGVSCSGSGDSGPKKVTYRCLVSSCDATVTCNEGDPVPQHCGKPMIR